MSLLHRLFGRASFPWLRMIPGPFRPTSAQARALEEFRKEHRIPHEVLAGRVMDSRITTRRVQAASVDLVRRQRPGASDVEVWQSVLEARALPQPPFGWGWDGDRMRRAMAHIKSFEDLVALVIETDDGIAPRAPDPLGLG